MQLNVFTDSALRRVAVLDRYAFADLVAEPRWVACVVAPMPQQGRVRG
jgi:hypothetical protein